MVIRTRDVQIDPSTGTVSDSAFCDPDEQVIAGGYDLRNAVLTVDRSFPADRTGAVPPPGSPATQWNVQVHNPQRTASTITIYAVCVPR